MEINRYSEHTVTVYLGDEIDESVNRQLVQLKNYLERQNTEGITEIIISYTSLIVNFDIFKTSAESVIKMLKSVDIEALLDEPFKYKIIEIPVCYGGEYGPDLERFEAVGLTPEEVVTMHSDTEYIIYMLGFMPGFPYLGGLDQKLFRDRLETPRKKVPKGSVGIGGRQTGMYPFESPGGWNLLGRTPIPLFDETREPKILYGPGDRIKFKQIDESEYQSLMDQVQQNQYEVTIYEEAGS